MAETERMWEHREKVMLGYIKKEAIYKPSRDPSEETNSLNTLIWVFQPPELWEISFCCLVMAAWWINIPINLEYPLTLFVIPTLENKEHYMTYSNLHIFKMNNLTNFDI